jgi:hypothetical protein
MKIVYARSPLQRSIFLAGPTPREAHVQSWRPEALRLLDEQGFDGTVFVPEDSDSSPRFNYYDQIEWELQALHSATIILFWVPREMKEMPALTTNVEFGLFARNGNIVLGCPPNAEKMKYLIGLSNLYNIPLLYDLESAVNVAIFNTRRPFRTS